MFLLQILLNFLSLEKCLSINVVFCNGYIDFGFGGGGGGGELNQVIFHFLVLFLSLFVLVFFVSRRHIKLYIVVLSNHFSASASLNIWAFLELVDRRLFVFW